MVSSFSRTIHYISAFRFREQASTIFSQSSNIKKAKILSVGFASQCCSHDSHGVHFINGWSVEGFF